MSKGLVPPSDLRQSEEAHLDRGNRLITFSWRRTGDAVGWPDSRAADHAGRADGRRRRVRLCGDGLGRRRSGLDAQSLERVTFG
jgi:hypothetical protein